MGPKWELRLLASVAARDAWPLFVHERALHQAAARAYRPLGLRLTAHRLRLGQAPARYRPRTLAFRLASSRRLLSQTEQP